MCCNPQRNRSPSHIPGEIGPPPTSPETPDPRRNRSGCERSRRMKSPDQIFCRRHRPRPRGNRLGRHRSRRNIFKGARGSGVVGPRWMKAPEQHCVSVHTTVEKLCHVCTVYCTYTTHLLHCRRVERHMTRGRTNVKQLSADGGGNHGNNM